MLCEATASYRPCTATSQVQTKQAERALPRLNHENCDAHPVEGLRNTPAALSTIGVQLWAAPIAIIS